MRLLTRRDGCIETLTPGQRVRIESVSGLGCRVHDISGILSPLLLTVMRVTLLITKGEPPSPGLWAEGLRFRDVYGLWFKASG